MPLPVRICSILLLLAQAVGAQDAPQLQYPLDVAVIGEERLVADRRLPGIISQSDELRVWFQAEKRVGAPLYAVRCLAVDNDGRLLAGDTGTRNIYRFDEEKRPVPLLEGPGVGMPMAIAVDSQNRILIADLQLHQILRLAPGAKRAEKLADVPAPRGVAVDKQDRVWVVSHGADQVVRIDPQGKLDVVVKGRPFKFPNQIALDSDGQAYVADGYGKAVYRIQDDGSPKKLAVEGKLVNPVGLAWTEQGLLVADPRAAAIVVVGQP